MIDYLLQGGETHNRESCLAANHQLSIINAYSFAILSIRSALRQE
jgi:hypothetical protein